MATNTRIELICDVCEKSTESGHGVTSHTIQMDRRKAVRVDLCQGDFDQVEAIVSRGRPDLG